MLSLAEVQELNQYLTELTERIADTIRNKPIKRHTGMKGSFEAPVSASGNLADSIEYEIGDNQITILANSYIDNVLFGTPPGRSSATLSEIELWIAHKGLDLTPHGVLRGLELNGSSIWQEWQGAETNLLEDFVRGNEVNPEILKELSDRVAQKGMDKFIEEMLTSLNKAA
jgi:hypothetical protein